MVTDQGLKAITEATESLHDKIEKLQTALRFYANENHYNLFFMPSSMGDYETSHIQIDNGSIARDALEEKSDD